MKTFIYTIVAIFGVIAYVRYLEQTTVFHPSRVLQYTPKDIGLAFEDLMIQTHDKININAWFIPSSGAKATLVYLHGNAGNLGDRLEKISTFHKMGLNILIIDYRGYGKSQGHPSEKGIYIDAITAYDYLISRSDIDPAKVIIYGGSLGGAVAVELASRRRSAAVILDSTFSSAADMAKRIFPVVPSFLIKTKLDSLSKIRSVTSPKIFIHSAQDETIPYEFGLKLFEAAPEPKEFLKISGTHEDALLYDAEKFTGEISKFLRRYNLI